ncbi:TnsA-like heteromeric transposase endonuclease subunit [Streptomyces sporangiiformans]|uniref:TnsA-like heteromeric transposase endonuclease subunit n=1 Tax=Streptomyces sporangiiformans TaxID=2315329 RepID=UPI001F097DB9|nr:TnsA-like heteromeric transposase endonuclease subunit [Streptomyces sporangiiformans]
MWAVRFEDVPPVREFKSYKGQRHLPGLWWPPTAGGHIGYESWLERDHVMLLDFDPSVVGLSSQPFWLFWASDKGKSISLWLTCGGWRATGIPGTAWRESRSYSERCSRSLGR